MKPAAGRQLEADAKTKARMDAEKKAHERNDDADTARAKGEEAARNAVVAPKPHLDQHRPTSIESVQIGRNDGDTRPIQDTIE